MSDTKCFMAPCEEQVEYDFHAGSLCVAHASETRQYAPGVILTPHEHKRDTDPPGSNGGEHDDGEHDDGPPEI